MSSSEAPVSTSSETPMSSSLEAPVSSSTASPAPAPPTVPLPAIPLSSPGGGDVFTVVVPPARPSLGFAKKRVVG